MKRYYIAALAATAALLLTATPVFAQSQSPVEVTEEPGVCDPTTVTASVSEPTGVSNMYLVVDTDDGAEQYVNIPTDGSEVSLSVGPFAEDTTVYWHVFGGGERDYDIPLWNGYGGPTFGSDIVDYAASVGGSYSWVIAGTDDPNPFVTWNEFEAPGCMPIATFEGGGHLLNQDDLDSRRKDWLDLSFGGWATMWSDGSAEGEIEVNFHNVGDESPNASTFHGTEVVDMNLYDGNGTVCNDAMNMTINGTLDGESGYSIIFRAGDFGSPNTQDTARVTLYSAENGTGGVLYDTTGPFGGSAYCVGSARSLLDTGNLTIWQE